MITTLKEMKKRTYMPNKEFKAVFQLSKTVIFEVEYYTRFSYVGSVVAAWNDFIESKNRVEYIYDMYDSINLEDYTP